MSSAIDAVDPNISQAVPSPGEKPGKRTRGRKPQTGLPRMPALDGLRALAVAAVFAYHAEATWLPGGFLGVDVFFVLSGFLITSLLMDACRRTGTIDLKNFWLRRARRLLPAVVVLIAATVVAAAFIDPGQLSTLRLSAVAGLFYFENWHQIFAHIPYFSQFGRPPLLRHLWSLSVEEQFYLCWPPIVLLAYRHGGAKRVLQVAVVLAVASAVELIVLSGSVSVTRIYEGTDTRATTLLVGAIAALLWSPEDLRQLRVRAPAVAFDVVGLMGAAGLALLMLTVTDDTAGGLPVPLLLASIFSAGLILAVTDDRGILCWALSRRALVWIGQRSYGIYLWHWPVIVLTRSATAGYGQSLGLTLLQAVITVALATVSYAAIERPIRRLGLREYLKLLQRSLVLPRSYLQVPRAATVVVAGIAGIVIVVGIGTGLFVRPASSASVIGADTGLHSLQGSGTGPQIALHVGGVHRPPPAGRSGSGSGSGQAKGTNPSADKGAPKGSGPSSGSGSAKTVPQGPTMVFGDSVVLGCEFALEQALGSSTEFNADVGRQPQDTVAAVAAVAADHELPPRVVISLGDNGIVTSAMLHQLHSILAGEPEVVLVTPRVPDPWGPASADAIRAATSWWPTMRVADWEQLSANRDNWFTDGVHPNAVGITKFTSLIESTLNAPPTDG